MSRINQILNYPAVDYSDVSHFFDQAISELDTSLRIALPSVSEMCSENTFDVVNSEGTVKLNSKPTSATQVPTATHLPSNTNSDGYLYVCADGNFAKRAFYKWDGTSWKNVKVLYGIYVDAQSELTTYSLVPITSSIAVWTPVDRSHLTAFDLTDYLPMDWWTLFIIPYVCFKFSVRNGDSGELFADEFTQGFQQLQSSYSVPNTVKLSEVAGKQAYTKLVEQHLSNLGTAVVFTRAIYEDMRVGNGIASVYGGFYENGGWGI